MTLSLSQLALIPDAIADEPTAAQLSDQAYAKYEAGDFPGAVALYMKAYAINVDARILFNVAQIYDRKVQDRDLALEYYRRYLKSTTTEEDLVRKATARVAELQRQVDNKPKVEAAPAPVPPPQPAPTAKPTPSGPTPDAPSGAPYWVGYTAAGLFAVGGGILGGLALSSSSDLKSLTYAGKATSPEVDSAASGTKAKAIAADALIGVAVVTLAVTIIVHASSSKGSKDTKSATAPNAAGPAAAWRF